MTPFPTIEDNAVTIVGVKDGEIVVLRVLRLPSGEFTAEQFSTTFRRYADETIQDLIL